MSDYDAYGGTYLEWCEADRPYWLIEQTPDDRADLAPAVQWYLDDPSCAVVSAVKPGL